MPEQPLSGSLDQHAKDWSDAELNAAVQAYLGMLHAELDGRPYNKAEVNRQLREGHLSARTKGSIEFRMQNISAALYELKMPWIGGYLPAKNIGSSVKEKLIELLRLNGVESLAAYVPTADSSALDQKVSTLRKRHLGTVPKGSQKPALITASSTSFVRDPAVKAWVLQEAAGRCEACGDIAPFVGQDGLPYLEVHHVMPLASHGSDTVGNAVALCPNCHRRCHYSVDRDEFRLALYQSVSRLVIEVPEDFSPGTDEFIVPD